MSQTQRHLAPAHEVVEASETRSTENLTTGLDYYLSWEYTWVILANLEANALLVKRGENLTAKLS